MPGQDIQTAAASPRLANNNGTWQPSARTTRNLFIGIWLFGMVRIGCSALIVPIFTDVDEWEHFDLVYKYSRGYWPDQPHESPDLHPIQLIAMFGTKEFFSRPDEYPKGRYPHPNWKQPKLNREAIHINYFNHLSQVENHEAHSPPVYYALAAVWYRIGLLLGMSDPYAVYWVRFLDVFLYGILILVSYLFCRDHFSIPFALGVSLLVACFPNPIYYSINSDALSPTLSILALLWMLRWQRRKEGGVGLAIGAGLATSFCVLVKLSNAPILVAAAALLISVFVRGRSQGNTRQTLLKASWFCAAVLIPIVVWMVRNLVLFNDLTANQTKAYSLGWTQKPFSDWFNHPLFSIKGQYTFWHRLIIQTFSGDGRWHGGSTLPDSIVFPVFFIAAILMVFVGGVNELVQGIRKRRVPVPAVILCYLVVLTSVLELMILSLMWDFGRCLYPSREYPYFTSGRLIGVALVPFCILYVRALYLISGRIPYAVWSLIVASALLMIFSKFEFLRQAYFSEYNWFHLP